MDQEKILKMGALLGVAQGSANKPYVVSMSWIGNRKNKKFDVSFVGKGVTFDTGGISIKPSGGMEDMITDMIQRAMLFVNNEIFLWLTE